MDAQIRQALANIEITDAQFDAEMKYFRDNVAWASSITQRLPADKLEMSLCVRALGLVVAQIARECRKEITPGASVARPLA